MTRTVLVEVDMRWVPCFAAASVTLALVWSVPALATRHRPKHAPKVSAALRVAEDPTAELGRLPAPPDVGGQRLAAVDALLKLEPHRLEEVIRLNPDGSLKLDERGRLELRLWQRAGGVQPGQGM